MEERGGQPHTRGCPRLEWRTLLLLLGLALGLYLAVDVIQGGRMLRSSFSDESPNEEPGEAAVPEGPSSSSSSSSTPRKSEDVSATASTETRTTTTTTTAVDPKTGVETETTTTTTTVVTTVVAKHHPRPQPPLTGRFHTLLNPHTADAPAFDWSAPRLPLLPPDQAKRFLKEDKGTEWLPADVRAMVKPREKPVRVVVVFPLDCEIDLLEVRLMETYDVVDYFVIGESNYSQVGGAKRLHFWESRHRFERFWPKIRHMAYWEGFKDATQIKKHDWNNEDQERGLLSHGLRGLDDDDIILLTDADEIANADALNFYRHFTGYPPGGRIFVRWSQMGFFWKVPAVWTPQACMTTYAIAKQIGTSGIRKARFKLENGRDWWTLGSAAVVAGWHCSWCFPPQDYMNKFRNVIEAWWFHADELKDFTPEVFANARYKGTKPVAADVVVLDHEGIPNAAKANFSYLSDRDVFPKCGWCLMPKDPTSHPVGSIKPDDPLPEDMVKQSQQCSNDVTLAFTPYRR